MVGCVNAAAIAIRKIATRAPHEVRAASGERDDQAEQEQDGDVVEVADVRGGEEQAGRRKHRQEDHERISLLRNAPAPRARPVRIGIPSMRNALKL